MCCRVAVPGEVLVRQKLGFLNFSAAAGMDPTEVLQVYLAAACDPNEQVVLLHCYCTALAMQATHVLCDFISTSDSALDSACSLPHLANCVDAKSTPMPPFRPCPVPGVPSWR